MMLSTYQRSRNNYSNINAFISSVWDFEIRDKRNHPLIIFTPYLSDEIVKGTGSLFSGRAARLTKGCRFRRQAIK